MLWGGARVVGGAQLLFFVHFGGDIVVLRIAFATGARGTRCFGGFHAFGSAVARYAVASQAVDIFYFRGTDCAELCEYVLPRAAMESEGVRAGEVLQLARMQARSANVAVVSAAVLWSWVFVAYFF